jgi:hypothetical protein
VLSCYSFSLAHLHFLDSSHMHQSKRVNKVETTTDGHLIPFDDGHVPAVAKIFCGSTDSDGICTTKIVANQSRSVDLFFSTYENAVDEVVADALYDASVALQGAPWGTYVTMEEALACSADRKQQQQQQQQQQAAASNTATISNQSNSSTKQKVDLAPPPPPPTSHDEASLSAYHHTLAVHAVSQFLIDRAGSAISSDYHKIHGTAVWGLSAGLGSRVQYHIDYAELIRYETNIIYPPLYAGTLQCSRFTDAVGERIVGGAFEANLEGLAHYERFGYKCKKEPVLDRDTSSAWVSMPYRYNRGCVHDGDLPHLSTEITEMPEGMRRVIMGFNMFGHDCGPSAMAAPEHSKAFTRQVKMYQLLAKGQNRNANGGGGKGLDLEVIKQNKALTKLLVLAKREKIKKAYRDEVEMLRRDIPVFVNTKAASSSSSAIGAKMSMQIGDVVQYFVERDGIRAADVEVQIEQLVREGLLMKGNEDDGVHASCS